MNILVLVLLYFFIVFVGLRLVAPYFGFKMFITPRVIPEEVKAAILDLEKASNNEQTYLQNVYNFILEKNSKQWKHTRFQAAFRIPRLFVKDLKEIWQTTDFLYCTSINYLSFVLISESKFFKPEDVKVKHVFLNFVPHQYLKIRLGESWIDFDPAGAGVRGGLLGEHAEFFG